MPPLTLSQTHSGAWDCSTCGEDWIAELFSLEEGPEKHPEHDWVQAQSGEWSRLYDEGEEHNPDHSQP